MNISHTNQDSQQDDQVQETPTPQDPSSEPDNLPPPNDGEPITKGG